MATAHVRLGRWSRIHERLNVDYKQKLNGPFDNGRVHVSLVWLFCTVFVSLRSLRMVCRSCMVLARTFVPVV